MLNKQKLNDSLSALEFLIGKWKTSGRIFATPGTPQINIEGTDSYEWELSGQFILHRADVLMGREKNRRNILSLAKWQVLAGGDLFRKIFTDPAEGCIRNPKKGCDLF